MNDTIRILLGGVGMLDETGQYAQTANTEMAKTPFSVSFQSLPLGLLYLAAAQEKFGRHEAEYLLFDFNLPPTETFTLDKVYGLYAEHLETFRPDVVALGALSSRQAPHLERSIKRARAQRPKAKIIVGGAAATAEPERFLVAGADCVCLGEGEMTFTEFVDHVVEEKSLREVAGLALPNGDGKVYQTAQRKLIQDVDILPMPAWHLADVKGYVKRNNGVFSPLLTQRGCPYSCIYCQHDRKFRPHSAKRVVDEIERIKSTYQATTIDLVDEIFNCQKGRVLEIADEMKRRKLKVALQDYDGLRADILDEETVQAMAEMGFLGVSVAVESSAPRVQKLINKRLKVDKALKAIEMLVSSGIFVNTFFMIGFPTETADEILDTIATARDCHAHQSTISKVELYPNTALWRLAEERGLDPSRFDPASNERYGERASSGCLEISESKLHKIWCRGIFDVYNNPPRMRRLHMLLGDSYLPKMYEKFYREHGIWSADFADVFKESMKNLEFDSLAGHAERCFPLEPLEALVAD